MDHREIRKVKRGKLMNEHAEVIRYVATLVEAVESDIIKSNYQIATGKFEAAYELLADIGLSICSIESALMPMATCFEDLNSEQIMCERHQLDTTLNQLLEAFDYRKYINLHEKAAQFICEFFKWKRCILTVIKPFELLSEAVV